MPELDTDGLWADDPGMMTTWTRRRVNPLTMTVEDVDIRDIAHSLARQCRYNGHVYQFLSVARHSLMVSNALPEHLKLAGLLHDAAEAYLGDLIRPLKHGPMGALYLEAEEHVERTIFAAFGLPYPLPAEVAEADRQVLTEMELPDGGLRWGETDYLPHHDERGFLARFEELAKPVIVGMMGYAQAGKDSAASVLIERYGFQRIAFADTLRDVLYALNPLASGWLPGVTDPDAPVTLMVKRWVDGWGWGYAKANTEVRELLQRLGTEAGRQILGENVWVDAAMAKVKPGGRYVFTDVRFPNEADAIEAAGGELWRVHREGTAPVNAHPSETALDDRKANQRIHNSGADLADFKRLVDSIAFHHLGLVPTA